jgi:hypothetical protein
VTSNQLSGPLPQSLPLAVSLLDLCENRFNEPAPTALLARTYRCGKQLVVRTALWFAVRFDCQGCGALPVHLLQYATYHNVGVRLHVPGRVRTDAHCIVHWSVCDSSSRLRGATEQVFLPQRVDGSVSVDGDENLPGWVLLPFGCMQS